MKLTALIAAGLGVTLSAALQPETPTEFGRVAWERKLEPALELSAKTGKPVWLQFQEVPG